MPWRISHSNMVIFIGYKSDLIIIFLSWIQSRDLDCRVTHWPTTFHNYVYLFKCFKVITWDTDHIYFRFLKVNILLYSMVFLKLIEKINIGKWSWDPLGIWGNKYTKQICYSSKNKHIVEIFQFYWLLISLPWWCGLTSILHPY